MPTTDESNRPGMSRVMTALRPGQAAVIVGVAVAVAVALLWTAGPEPLPDFSSIKPVDERKRAFFEFLAPIVRAENARVLEQRRRLLEIAEAAERGARPDWLDRRWLAGLSERYEVDWNPDEPLARLDRLKRRVDAVPVSLALIQAATESGWGRSRFAVEANNLFGHWCFRRGCGMVPARRDRGAGHEVASFDSVRESVRRYLRNLNTHWAYQPLRAIRARLRRQGRPLASMTLADGLVRYSERRDDYVDEIKTLIRVNRPILQRVGVSL